MGARRCCDARVRHGCLLSDKTERAVDIELDGGKLHVEWGADNHAYMTGPAVKVFEGIYENEK